MRRQRRSSSGSGHSSWGSSDRGRHYVKPKQAVDAKALKPQMLETSMPSLSLKEWFTCFENYREASGWGQDSNKTQLAYLRMCVSEEIRSAVSFDHMKTVQEALYDIKKYLDKAVMPLTLRQLEVIRYRPPAGTSQTQAVQTMLQMYREAEYWRITPEQLCKVL